MLSFKPAYSLSSFTLFKRLFSSSLLSAIRVVSSAYLGFPDSSVGKESACNAGDLGSVPGLRRSSRNERLPTPVFWPGEFHGRYSPWGCKELDTTK